jgi:hypothetical protein
MSTALKGKTFYIPINATEEEDLIIQRIGEKLCPKIIYAAANTETSLQYLEVYAKETATLTLNIN